MILQKSICTVSTSEVCVSTLQKHSRETKVAEAIYCQIRQMHDCSVSEVPKFDSLEAQSTMGHRMRISANTKSQTNMCFMNMRNGVIDRKQEYHMPMQLKRKSTCCPVFFLKPTAFSIKIESP